MINKLIQDQLNNVKFADLSNFYPESNTYIIKKREDIKFEEDSCYLIHIKVSAFTNTTLAINWNNGSYPPHPYLKVDVSKIVGKMVKVVGIGFDPETSQDLSIFWSGWLFIEDVEILSKI